MAVQRKKLLYVEDEDSAWRLVHHHLKENFVLVRAKNENEACMMLREFGAELSALLIDITLGGELSGLDLVRIVRGKANPATLPDWAKNVPVLPVPIVIITGDPRRAAQAEGVSAVIGKPIDFDALIAALPPPARASSPSSPGIKVTS